MRLVVICLSVCPSGRPSVRTYVRSTVLLRVRPSYVDQPSVGSDGPPTHFLSRQPIAMLMYMKYMHKYMYREAGVKGALTGTNAMALMT